MALTPVQLGTAAIAKDIVKADKAACKPFGPCGVGKAALYIGTYFIDRYYYIALDSVQRVFKRVAMSRGGFSGHGVFGAIPYLVVQYDNDSEKQCAFKHEEDVDALLGYMAQVRPSIPIHSEEAERRLAEKAREEEARYLKEMTPQAQSAREALEDAKTFLAGYPSARALRINQHTNPAHKWIALAIVLAGLIAAIYGILAWRRHEGFGMYFTLLGLAVVFLFSGTQVIPTMKNNRRAVTRAWADAQNALANVLPERFPLPARYAHPIVLDRMIRVLREGRAQSADEALSVVKTDLMALTSDVQVSQEEYDEVVAVKPMFLVSDYQ